MAMGTYLVCQAFEVVILVVIGLSSSETEYLKHEISGMSVSSHHAACQVHGARWSCQARYTISYLFGGLGIL